MHLHVTCNDSAISLHTPGDSALAVGPSKPTCLDCSKTGHGKEDCWSKGGGKKWQGPRCQKKGKEEGKGGGMSANTATTTAVKISKPELYLPYQLRCKLIL